MKKIATKVGYIAYEATQAEVRLLGSPGICDECSNNTPTGYLVPVLNHYQCPACFEDWSKKARYYPEDICIERRNAAYYESTIALANQI